MKYEVSGRNGRAIGLLAAIYLFTAAALVFLEAHIWIVAGVVVMTLPALWDILVDRGAGLTLDGSGLTWFSGDISDAVALSAIDHVRFDTRMDLSVKVTVILAQGCKIRLPYDCLPPHRAFEAQLVGLKIRTERHHFGQL